MNPGSSTPKSEATYTNRIDAREFYMNGIFSRQVVYHIFNKYPPSAMDGLKGLSTDSAIRSIIHTGLRYNHMSVKDNSLFLLVALKQITKNDLTLSSHELVDKVKSENTDEFDLDVVSRVVAQATNKLPADLRERMTPRQKVAIMTYVNNQVMQPSIGEAFTNSGSSNTNIPVLHAGTQPALNSAHASGDVIFAEYVDDQPVLHMDVRTKELYYYDENSHALIPMSDIDSLNSKGVSIEDLEKYLKNHDLSNAEIKKLLNSVTNNKKVSDEEGNNKDGKNTDDKNTDSKKKSSSGIGMILGITFGIVSFLLVVALFLYFMSRK